MTKCNSFRVQICGNAMHFVSYNELNPHKYCGNMFSNDKYANNLIIAFSAAYISMDFHFLG